MTAPGPGGAGGSLRVVVCGTTFGQSYAAAVAALRGRFELVGILARGSARSRACAERAGVPLLTDLDQLPHGVDAAAVVVRSGAMGGQGTDLARALLERGVHVVQEQPVHHDELAGAFRDARAHHAVYQVGDLYVHLPAVRRFVAAARALLAREPAVYVDAACSVQVAFPLVHILGEALGGVRPWRFDTPATAPGDEAPLTAVTGVIAGVPLTLRVQNQLVPDDPDNHLHLLHRVTIGTEAGAVTLADTSGPVLWTPRLHVPAAVRHRFDFDDPTAAHLRHPASTPLGPVHAPSYRDLLGREFPLAIGRGLVHLHEAAQAAAGSPHAAASARSAQYHLTLCRVWQDLTAQLGYPRLVRRAAPRPLPADELLAAVAAVDEPDLPLERVEAAR